MSELTDKLFSLASQLEEVAKRAQVKAITEPIQRLSDAATQVGRAWSGSCLGYQSRVYYANLESPPAGAHFSMEWGFKELYAIEGTAGEWHEYTFDQVRDSIFAAAKVKSLDSAKELAKEASEAFQQAREDFLSTITVALQKGKDPFLSRLKSQAEELKLTRESEFARAFHPRGQFMSRDSLAVGQGIQTPPHFAVIAEICALKNPPDTCEKLAKIARTAASHLEVRDKQIQEKRRVGTNVFIGHGGSPAWRDLKDFIQDRIGLPWDEFNRVPVAGITNITRLSQMLDEAAIAFLVLTGEDERVDGKMQARMNVIHEAGLFQGRLGFTKAIVLLEEGCEEFTNIQGLGQIRFPKGNISAKFEEVRRVLEREGLIEP